MGLFWIFGGAGEAEGGGRDFLITVHSLDEARAWLESHPQTWTDVFVWRDGKLELEESYRDGEKVNPPKKKGK